jgi:hypothetical protein
MIMARLSAVEKAVFGNTQLESNKKRKSDNITTEELKTVVKTVVKTFNVVNVPKPPLVGVETNPGPAISIVQLGETIYMIDRSKRQNGWLPGYCLSTKAWKREKRCAFQRAREYAWRECMW